PAGGPRGRPASRAGPTPAPRPRIAPMVLLRPPPGQGMSAEKAKRGKQASGKRARKETWAPARAARAPRTGGGDPAHESRIRWIVFAGMAVATTAFFASFVFDRGAMLFGTD